MRWPGDALGLIDGAIAAARGGEPTVVALEGEAGYGKSALLRELGRRLPGFHVLRAFGEESAQDERLQLLREWDAITDGGPVPQHALQAARLLGTVVDRLQLTGPVALLVDDLQWIDPDSVAALAALAQRTAGDRLLIATAYRPLARPAGSAPAGSAPAGTRRPGAQPSGAQGYGPRPHAAWQRVVDSDGRVVRLDGLDDEAAADLVASIAPAAPPQLARQLAAHTAGNPLYVRALLREHPAAELSALAARGELPAPAVLAAHTAARVARLDPDAARLLHALAVLGDAWSEPGVAAAIAGVPDAAAAIAVLRAEGLVRADQTTAVPRIRIYHAVVRAAVYEQIPLARRRGLHGAAAARLPAPGDRLLHRVAAASAPDEGIAGDLEAHASELHDRQRYREAARFLRLAAMASPDPAQARRRDLDAGFDAVLAHDLDEVAPVAADAEESPHRRVVAAQLLATTKEWVRGARLLAPLTDADLAALPARTAYRARVLRGWLTVATGGDARAALADLEAARSSAVQDPALRGAFTFAYGQARQPFTGEGDLWGFESERGTDRAALSGSADGLTRLSWRGSVYALTGMSRQAIDDLSLVVARISDGTIGFGDGVMHSLLGFAQWIAGEWRRASISIGLPLASPLGGPHPVAVALTPLAAVVEGKPPGPAIAASRAARLAGPVPAGLYCADMADVAALAFAGTDAERRDWRARRIADFGDPLARTDGAIPYLWLVATGLGAAWAGEAGVVDECARLLEIRDGSPWREQATAWLRALAAGARGEPSAGALLAVGELPQIASFEAIWLVAAATAAAAERHPDAAQARARAEAALRALGAGAYAAALLPAAPASLAGPAGATRPADPLAPLSDREREVVALLMDGLSYAQIARELYVTRSTVAFHLSNAYAKTSTRSRHELVQLTRVP
jgi:DNA-binding CsgD family transcriptional regulator